MAINMHFYIPIMEFMLHRFYPCPPPPSIHLLPHTHTLSTQGTEDIPLSDHNLVVMVTNTNYKHELVAGEYRERRESCESAAAKLGKALLKEVTMEDLEGVWYGCPTSVCQVASFSGCLQLGEALGTRLHTLLEL